jgi:quercetin dioxygenase-like cupin family protein
MPSVDPGASNALGMYFLEFQACAQAVAGDEKVTEVQVCSWRMVTCTIMQLEFTREGCTEMAKAKRAVSTHSKTKSARRKTARIKRAAKESRARKMELKHIPWSAIELEDLNPLFQRQFVVGQEIMVARVLMKKGCIVPLHSHHNEQFTYILEGALKFWVDGKEIVVNAGEVLTIPPHMPHKAEAMVDTVDLDIFNPPRADWINKTDQYLRGGK